MAKKPSSDTEEKSKSDESKTTPNYFALPYEHPFYILETPNKDDLYYVFNTLEGAVKFLDELDDFDTENTKLLSFTRDEEQFSITQISWAEIYQISKEIRKKER